MPPLGATLAATLLIGVGMALAKAGRGRLAARRSSAPDLGLHPQEQLDEGLRRTALEQLDLALEQLQSSGQTPPDEQAVHETRKALKRLRTMFRLLAPALPADALAQETAALGDAAARLAGARDSKVMLATLEALIERHPRKLGRNAGVRRLHAHLASEHELISAQTLGDPTALSLVLAQLHLCRAQVELWQLPGEGKLALVKPGLRRLYADGRKRFRRVAAGKGDQALAMHEWRKRVKDLRYATEMLQRSRPAPALALVSVGNGRSRRRQAQAQKQAQELRDVARRADELGELLGEDHDLAVLATLTRQHAKRRAGGPRIGRRARRRLLKAIEARRRKLRRRALREGERLYRRGPKKFIARARAAYRAAA